MKANYQIDTEDYPHVLDSVTHLITATKDLQEWQQACDKAAGSIEIEKTKSKCPARVQG